MTSDEQPRGGAQEESGDFSAIARALLMQSVVRGRLFEGLMRQPTWDMLLCLYLARGDRAELSLEAMCALSGETLPTAQRRLRAMEAEGLVTIRNGDPEAGRERAVITDEAAASLERLLQELAAGSHLEEDPLRSGVNWSISDESGR